MSLSLFWKSIVFWTVVLFGFAIAAALMPGSEKWPGAVPFVLILAIAIGQIWYVNRKLRNNPEAYKPSPRARRISLLLSIAVFAVVGVENYFTAEDRQWQVGLSLLCGLVVLLSAYRLYQEMHSGHPEGS